MRQLALLAALSFATPLAAAVVAAPLAAQIPAALADPLAVLTGRPLTAGSWTYRATVTRNGATVELARRTLTVRPTTYDGRPSWLIVDDTRARGQAMTDSLVVTADSLRPVRRVADMGPMRIALAFAGDTIRVTTTVPGESTPESMISQGGRRVVVSGGMLEAVLPLLPLAAGWTGTVAQLVPTPLGVSVVPLTLTVAAEESVTVPAGTFAAWRVTAEAAGSEQRLWIGKRDGRLLRQEASPGSSDVVYRTELVEVGTPPR